VEVAVFIVLLNMKTFRSQSAAGSYLKNKKEKRKNHKFPQMARDESVYQHIYEIVRLIPKGRVSSYGAIAAAIGVKSGARMVGYALSSSFGIKPWVPAHRVVNRNGLLTGKHHFGSPTAMQELLEKEGIKIEDNQVVNFESLFWDPLKEIEI